MVKDDASASSGNDDEGKKRRSASTYGTRKELRKNKETFHTVHFYKVDYESNAMAKSLKVKRLSLIPSYTLILVSLVQFIMGRLLSLRCRKFHYRVI